MASPFYQMREKKRVLIHAGDSATEKATIYVIDEAIVAASADGKNSVAITNDWGTCIQGPVSFMQYPSEIRVAGLWKINPLVLTSLPSTTYTPIPWLRQSIPESGKELVRGLAEVAKALKS